MKLPLKGIRVLDLTTMLPGPLCTQILADFGAEVIKFEQPGGSDLFRAAKPTFKGTSSPYLLVNRNKKSMTLNLKTEEGKKIFYSLARKADVVIEQFRPGAVKRMGVDYETIKAINSQLIYCSLSGYGQDGPYAQQSGHDLNYLSYAGVLGMTARNGVPTLPGVQIADVGGGTLMAVIGILMALMARENSGVGGQYIDISMLDGAISFLPIVAGSFFATGKDPQPGQTKLTGKNACYEVYETRDGGYISLGPIEPHLWANLCRCFSKEEFIAWQNEDDKQAEMFSFLKEQILLRDRDEWVEILKEVDVCVAPVLNISEVFTDPHVLHRNMVFEMDHPRLGKIKQLGFPIKLSETPARAETAPPDLGEHTAAILQELGYSSDAIASLREQKVV